MPRYVRPPTPLPAATEAAIDALATPFGRAVVRHLAQNGPSSSHQLAEALGTGPTTVRRTLGQLEAAGLITASVDDGDRKGRRVRYAVDLEQVDSTLRSLRTYLRGR